MSHELPQGACDSHCHVFGPASRFPYAAERPYTPQEAPKEQLFALHRKLGLDHAMIVQPAAHGFDNSVTLDAIAASGLRYRGIALVPPAITEGEIFALHKGGIRGVRFNFLSHLSSPPNLSDFRRIAELIAPFGWHVVLHVMPNDMPILPRYIDSLAVPFVIDHMGRISAADGMKAAGFHALRELVQNPNGWVKISGADRASAQGAPYSDVIPFARALIETAPRRILWGTDWPHPNIKGPMPSETDLLAFLKRVAPEPEMFRAILCDNPNRLYRFDEHDFD
jgi:predicted TIM-barrel fold metal-dependent hydrolase